MESNFKHFMSCPSNSGYTFHWSIVLFRADNLSSQFIKSVFLKIKNMVVITLRELTRAWRQATAAFNQRTDKTNADRLLLFYAVENGLKAIMLKNLGKTDTEGLFTDIAHDLNKLLDLLKVQSKLRLPHPIELQPLRNPDRPRNPSSRELNQIWRYGAQANQPTDQQLENILRAINDWVDKNI